MAGRKEKSNSCSVCGFRFSNFGADRVCSNCFACTGCEIYFCPSCGKEVEVKAIKPLSLQ